MNDPAQLLSVFLDGTLGRSGRKRARNAADFLSGRKGFLTASTLLAAAGVAWGVYDSLKGSAPPPPAGPGAPAITVATPRAVAALDVSVPAEVLRIIRLAVSAARADGTLSAQERHVILDHARKAGVERVVEQEIERPQPLADIVRGVEDEQARRDLYTLAFTIVRADESVSGGERIYLAQLAHYLGLDPGATARLDAEAAASIDKR